MFIVVILLIGFGTQGSYGQTITASTPQPLTEATLHESVVTLTLNGGTYERAVSKIRDAVSVSGIDGVTVRSRDVDRESDTEVTVELTFEGDFDTDAILTFTVSAEAIAGYSGNALTATLPVTAMQESLTASMASPLTEATLNESVVTLTLNGGTYERAVSKIRDAVSVSGIDGVTVRSRDVDRESDTEVTVELTFEGDFDTDAILTFTVSAEAIAGYNGQALTVQVPVTAMQESLTASMASPLTEATLNESVVTLTLSGRRFADRSWDIERAVSVSGIDGVTFESWAVGRESDTEVTVELTFEGDFDTDAILTFTVGAEAIAGYNEALTAQVPVTAIEESLVPSTVSPLTETTLHESVVTLTLNGGTYERAVSKIRDAVSVSGIDGVTVRSRDVDRESDTEVTVELTFEGDFDTDAILTFTVSAEAIAGYSGNALTAQVPVTAIEESLVPSTVSPLTETTLHGSVVTLTLSGRNYVQRVRGGTVTVSGIDGVTFESWDVDRVSDTEVTVELTFEGDFDTDAILTFTVSAEAIAGYSGNALTAQVPVTAIEESLVASTASPLTETTLHGSVVTLTLSGRNYKQYGFQIADALTISGIDGVTFERWDVERISDTEATVELTFDGDFDTDTTLTFSVSAEAIAGYNGQALTAQVPVTAMQESLVASTEFALTEATLHGSIITFTLSGRQFADAWYGNAVSLSGIDGVTVGTYDVERISDTEATVELTFDGDLDTNATLTFTVSAEAIVGYNEALTAQVPVTAVEESLVASTASPLTETTLHGSVVTLTLSGRSYAYRGSVSVSGIDGVAIRRGGVSRVSDTEITAALTFSGNLDTDTTLTFTVSAELIAGYNEALTAQVPVTAIEESLVASTASPLTETTLHGSVVTLTLSGRNYKQYGFQIADALTISGIDGVTFERWDVERISDTEATVELTFDGDFDTDATLTFTVGAEAIAGYSEALDRTSARHCDRGIARPINGVFSDGGKSAWERRHFHP